MALLSDARAIQFCKDKKGPIFVPSLNWHKTEWARQLNEGQEFNQRESRRVQLFKIAEAERVAEAKVEAITSFTVAASAFGFFMTLSLLLIFSNIETNLRNKEVVERSASLENETS